MVRIFSLMLVLLVLVSTNIPPIMIINMIYEHQNLLSLVSFVVGLWTYQHLCNCDVEHILSFALDEFTDDIAVVNIWNIQNV